MPDNGEHPATMGDGRPATAGDGRRLTYAQIAARLGISGDAARIMVRRRGWQRITPNHPRGVTVVIVPDEALADEDWRRVGETDPDEPAATGDTQAEQRATEAERRADEAHQRADAALAVADRALAQLAEAQATVAVERARVTDLQRDLDAARERLGATSGDLALVRAAFDQAQGEAKKAREAAEALRRAEADRKARGLMARLRAAWRGE